MKNMANKIFQFGKERNPNFLLLQLKSIFKQYQLDLNLHRLTKNLHKLKTWKILTRYWRAAT